MREKEAIKRIESLLSEITHLRIQEVETPEPAGRSEDRYSPDMVIRTPEKSFIIEVKSQSTAESIGAGIRQLSEYRKVFDRNSIPLLVVPFMGDVGRRLCEESGLSWMDLSGNASIHAAGLHVRVEGRPNKFARPGRPKNLFAPKASRVPRILLLSPRRPRTQKELVSATGLTKGYVSKAVNRFLEAALIVRHEQGAVFPKDPDLLLDAWAQAYSFHEHKIHKAHIAVRSPQAAIGELAKRLTEAGIQHAVTGLAAAWHYTSFAGFRLITFYVEELPDPYALKDLSYRAVDSGANLWLVIPKDVGVFAGTVHHEKIPFVSAVQAFLDLKGHPERASEAAEEVRSQCLKWNGDERR